MFDQWIATALARLPEVLIYLTMVVTLIYAFISCFTRVNANARALRRGAKVMRAEANTKVSRPSWNDLRFLGDGLQNEWATFLQNAELMDLYGDACDVEAYINEDTVIYGHANTSLAELVPGVMVSLGILGTFLGITQGLPDLSAGGSSQEWIQNIAALLSGMKTAYLTSIMGIIASLAFNFANRTTISRARQALARFVAAFQQYGMPRPPASENKLLAIQQQQSDYLRTFVEDVSVRTAAQMEQAITRALLPVQRSMDNFIVAATREQVEGIDRVVARFVERMNTALEGQFTRLGDTLGQLNAAHHHTQADLQASAAAISTVVSDVTALQGVSQQMITQFEGFVKHIDEAQALSAEQSAQNAVLLENIHTAAQQQAKYLTKLQDYQAALQSSQQQYTAWNDKFMRSAEEQTKATSQSLSQIALQMQDSATLLQSSYLTFVEQVQEGLGRALSLLDEGVNASTRQLGSTLAGIHEVVDTLPKTLSTSSRKYATQVEQFVEALQQLQKAMNHLSGSIQGEAAKREVS